MLFSKDPQPVPPPPDPGAAGHSPAVPHAIDLPNHDLHNHTIFSGHADDDATVQNLIARANALHLDVLGISEHLMHATDRGMYERFRGEALQHRSTGTQVLIGVEMDLDTTSPEGRWVVPQVDCDYVILSAHGLPRFEWDPIDPDPALPSPAARRSLAMRWLNWYGPAVARGGMQILGHPLREPINMGFIDLADPVMLEASLALFRPAIDQGVAFELNDAFLEYLQAVAQFDEYVELIRRLKAAGMRFSRGSDSHGVTELGRCASLALAADAAGLHAADWIDPRTLLGH